jgi:hypothetical protein
MSIAEFIQNNILRPRLQKSGALVVYDPAGQYQNLCQGLADEKLVVVDASKSSIESRVAALQALRDVIDRQLTGVLVYVPAKAPSSGLFEWATPLPVARYIGLIPLSTVAILHIKIGASSTRHFA